MKKTFLKGIVAGAVLALTMAATSVCAMAATTVLFDGSGSTAVYGEGVTTAPSDTGDSKTTADGVAYSKRIKLAKTDAAYIQFSASGDFTLDVMGRAGGTAARNWLVADVTSGTSNVLLTQAAVVTDKTYIYPNSLAVKAAATGTRTYKLYTDNEVSVYYLTLTDSASSYPTFASATTETTGYRPGTTVSSKFRASDFEDMAANTAANVTVGDYTLISGGKSLTVETLTDSETGEASTKTIDGIEFSKRVKTEGSGTATTRAISFSLTEASVIKVYGASGSAGTLRGISLYKDGTKVDTVNADEAAAYTLSASGAGSYVITGDANVSIYGFDVLPAVETVLPQLSLTNSKDTDGKLLLTASLNGDFEYTVTGLGFILARPGTTGTTTVAVYNFKGSDADGYQFIGQLTNEELKAQAYVTYTDDAGETVTVYSTAIVVEA